MKTLNKAALLAVGVALASSPAFAGYNNEDVLLSFFKAGATSDLIIDLGQVSQYTASSSFDLSTVGFTKADLLSQFGGSLNGVVWSVFAGDAVGQSDAWVSRNSATAWAAIGGGTMGSVTSAINGFGVNDIGGPAATAVGSSTTEYTVPVGNSFSASKYQGTAGKINGTFTDGNIDLSGGATSFLTKGFFDHVQTTGNATTVLGDFTFNATTGDGMWNGASPAVPEPATYGVLAGFGLLALSLRRQLVRKQA